MRFYCVKIDGAPSAFQPIEGAPIAGAQFSSVANDQNDPGALRCMMRIEMVNVSNVVTNSFVRFYGVDINMLKQASNLNNLPIEVYAGFWPGLPLATEEAPYAGALYCGTIWQAFGNWEGEDMTLDLLLSPAGTTGGPGSGQTSGTASSAGNVPAATSFARLTGRQKRVTGPRQVSTRGVQPRGDTSDLAGGITGALSAIAASFGAGSGWGSTPANLIHNWQQGEALSNSIRRTLTQAFPWCSIDIGISDLLKNPGAQDSGFYQSLEQFMGFAKQTSLSLMSGTQGAVGTISGMVSAIAAGSQNEGLQALGNALQAAGNASTGSDQYPGIHTFVRCQRVIVTDYNPVNGIMIGPTLKFEELIGQPTWISNNQITFRVPMRADIYPPLTITLPPNTLQSVAISDKNLVVGGIAPSMSVNFTGPCHLTAVTATGDSRSPEGGAWALQCVATLASPAFQATQYPESSSFSSFPTSSGLPSNPSGPHPAPGPQAARYLARPVRRYGRLP